MSGGSPHASLCLPAPGESRFSYWRETAFSQLHPAVSSRYTEGHQVGSGPWAAAGDMAGMREVAWYQGLCGGSGLGECCPREETTVCAGGRVQRPPTCRSPHGSYPIPSNSKVTCFCPSMTGGACLNMLVWPRDISNSCTEFLLFHLTVPGAQAGPGSGPRVPHTDTHLPAHGLPAPVVLGDLVSLMF